MDKGEDIADDNRGKQQRENKNKGNKTDKDEKTVKNNKVRQEGSGPKR